jgi:hypothetical protein
MNKHERVQLANEVIKIISLHGRRFFSMASDVQNPTEQQCNTRSYFYLQAGRLFFIDKYTQKRIYPHYRGHWHNFSDGGTLRRVVDMLRNFISGKSESIDIRYFGPFESWYCGGDPWAYGSDMEVIRNEIERLILK